MSVTSIENIKVVKASAQPGRRETVTGNGLLATIASHDRAYTAEEIAELLQVSAKSIYKMTAGGTLPSMRIGSLIRLDPADVVDWLQGQKIERRKAA